MMKVALLTNLLHKKAGHINVGDVFIGQGLRYIIDNACPEKIEWVLVSRFSPLTPHKKELLASCDLIIYGGMPQYNNYDDWKFYYDDEIWDDLNAIGVPILRLAGGGGGSGEDITPEEYAAYLLSSELTKDILEKAMTNCKLVTTRDKMAQAFLDGAGVDSTLLPCSGTFAMNFNGVHETDKTMNIICLAALYLKNRPDKDTLIEEFKKTKAFLEKETGKPCKILCQVKNSDLPFIQEHFSEDEIIVEDEPMKIIEHYKHVEYCVTTRLHCALPIYGIGGKVVLIRVDTRGIAGEEMGIPVTKLSDYTHDKFKEIFENDGFSKIPHETTMNKCINFYKEFFNKWSKK